MDNNQIPAGILDSKDLEWNPSLVVAENQQPIRLCRIVGRRLSKGQSTVADRKAILAIANAVPMSRLKDSYWQRQSP